jgi:hypothetical protein
MFSCACLAQLVVNITLYVESQVQTPDTPLIHGEILVSCYLTKTKPGKQYSITIIINLISQISTIQYPVKTHNQMSFQFKIKIENVIRKVNIP